MIGAGIVGQAVASFFNGAKLYDKYKSMDTLDEVLDKDIIFVCVPTPYQNGFDRSILEEVFAQIGADKKERIVVIKSTSAPGTTDYFQEMYPHLRVLFNPEFLTQKTAESDFRKPDKQLIGFTGRSRPLAESVLEILPDAPYKKIMPAPAAELVKYAINTFYAAKVVFGNMLYDLAVALQVDYGQVKEAFVSDQRITDSHFDVFAGGYRGYGGKCLPKDLLALVDFAKKRGVDIGLLEKVDEMNRKYRESS